MKQHVTGFTLIELAIVLVVIGVLAGLGVGMIGFLVKRAHYNQNRERLEANVEALIGFALSHNGRLPSPDNCSQVLPNTKDVWGKNFICVIAPELSTNSACSQSSSTLKVLDDNDNPVPKEVAFAIISGGPNYNVQTGNATPIHIYYFGTQHVDDYPADMNRPELYDDMVRYMSLYELKGKLNCAHAEERLRILNNELPYGFANSSYNATVYAEGGVPFPSGASYEWCVEDPDDLRGAGISFDCGGNDPISGNCSMAGSWTQCDKVALSGTPTSPGTFSLTFYVRDNANNQDQRSFVVTINPSSGGGSENCSVYTVYNVSGRTLYWGCQCDSSCRWPNGTSKFISVNTATVTVYRSELIFYCFSDTIISYSDIQQADINGNCQVNYDGTLSDR